MCRTRTSTTVTATQLAIGKRPGNRQASKRLATAPSVSTTSAAPQDDSRPAGRTSRLQVLRQITFRGQRGVLTHDRSR